MLVGFIKTILEETNTSPEEKLEQIQSFINIYEKAYSVQSEKEKKRDRVKKQRNAFLQLQLRNASPNSKRKSSYFVQYKEKVFDSKKQPELLNGVFDCGTDDFEEALSKAIRYRETWLNEYNQRQLERERAEMFKVLLAFYQPGSPYLKSYEKLVNKKMSEDARARYDMYIHSIFIPYFKTHKNRDGSAFDAFSKINEVDLSVIRNWILTEYKSSRGGTIKPKTSIIVMSSLRIIYTTLLYQGLIKSNPFDYFKIKLQRGEENNIHKPFNASDYKKLFKAEWDNELYYMLCLLAFNTGCRNSEIGRICLQDIDVDNNYYYIHVRGTKTKAAARKVPINRFTYLKIMEYAEKNNLTQEIFPLEEKKLRYAYNNAVFYAGKLLGYSKEKMKENGYSFYGFRSFYSTLLHSSNIDFLVVEYLMGHTSGTVAERYTNFDVIAGELFKPIVEKFDEYLYYIPEGVTLNQFFEKQ